MCFSGETPTCSINYYHHCQNKMIVCDDSSKLVSDDERETESIVMKNPRHDIFFMKAIF